MKTKRLNLREDSNIELTLADGRVLLIERDGEFDTLSISCRKDGKAVAQTVWLCDSDCKETVVYKAELVTLYGELESAWEEGISDEEHQARIARIREAQSA